jgi:hypothetical protein
MCLYVDIYIYIYCLRKAEGNNLCGYYVCEFIHMFCGPKKIAQKEFDVGKELRTISFI